MPKKISTAASEVKLSPKEIDFLKGNELCRFATASKKGDPHVVPVSYIWDQDYAYKDSQKASSCFSLDDRVKKELYTA